MEEMNKFIASMVNDLPIRNNKMVFALTEEEAAKCLLSIKQQPINKGTEVQEVPLITKIEKMKGKELDELLKSNKLKVSGKVQEKKDRLVEFYTNKN
tara:strand:+ start:592 stop:882 length:291 start_codon:yes stop_codon:yes gene_type:complete